MDSKWDCHSSTQSFLYCKKFNEFDCGNHDLNRSLKKHAYINQISGNSATYISCQDNTVAGYYTITLMLESPLHKESGR